MSQQCVNCPGAVDHSTAECPMRASLPVGVPDGWALVPVEPTDEMRDAGNVHTLNRSTLFRSWHAMLAAAPAAPTVKAEHWKCDQCRAGAGEACNANGCFANERSADAAPSLTAAGSAVEEVEVVGTRYVAISESGRKISLVRLSRKRRPGWQEDDLMTVAQHNRIVSALSAQQSAPERVSVDSGELFSALGRISAGLETELAAINQLRALLASHAEGGKV